MSIRRFVFFMYVVYLCLWTIAETRKAVVLRNNCMHSQAGELAMVEGRVPLPCTRDWCCTELVLCESIIIIILISILQVLQNN